jgi:hypothetical protein
MINRRAEFVRLKSVVHNTRNVTHSSRDAKRMASVFVGFLDQWINSANKPGWSSFVSFYHREDCLNRIKRVGRYGDEEKTGAGVRGLRNRVLFCSVLSEVRYAGGVFSMRQYRGQAVCRY